MKNSQCQHSTSRVINLLNTSTPVPVMYLGNMALD